MRALLLTLACLSIGALALRLLRQWRDRGGAPEGWLAVLFGSLAVTVPSRVLSVARDLAGSALQEHALLVAHLAIATLAVATLGFTRVVFRPDTAWARALTRGGASLIGLMTGWVLLDPAARSEAHPVMIATNTTRVLAFAWPFVECARYARLMHRRLALGLADPVVANRFVLWAIWTGGLTIFGSLVIAVRLYAWSTGAVGPDADGPAQRLVPVLLVLGSMISVTAAGSVWLSFFPPRRYVRWLRAGRPGPQGPPLGRESA